MVSMPTGPEQLVGGPHNIYDQWRQDPVDNFDPEHYEIKCHIIGRVAVLIIVELRTYPPPRFCAQGVTKGFCCAVYCGVDFFEIGHSGGPRIRAPLEPRPSVHPHQGLHFKNQ